MNPNRPIYPDENRGLSFVLAVGMHAILAGFLLFSVQWKTKKPEPVVVELWGAPLPAPVANVQSETNKPVKVPVVKPEPVPEKDPEIVTEKVKATAIPKATAKPTVTSTVKPTTVPTAKPSAAPKATTMPKPTPLAKATAAPKKTAVPKKPKSELEDALGMDNLLGSSTEKGSPDAKVGGKTGGTGDTVGATGSVGKGKGAGLGEAYAKGVGQEIKQKIVYTPSSQNPRVAYKIYLLPSGEIRDIELIKASGDPKWDEAVKRAIQLYAPFPKPPAGASFNDYRDIRWEFAPK